MVTAPQKLYCNTCHGDRSVTLDWKVTSLGNAHLGAYCAICKSWVKWVPQSRQWLAFAPPKPEAPGQASF